MLDTNPYAHLRKRAGYTQKAFCDEFDFAKQTIIMIEHGTYPELSDRMVISMGKACFHAGFDARTELYHEYDNAESLQEAIELWRRAQRKQVPPMLLSWQPYSRTEEVSPMGLFVKDTIGSVQGFAKRLKVPPATLLRYIRGDQKFMPAAIREALIDSGYLYLQELEEIQHKWAVTYASV